MQTKTTIISIAIIAVLAVGIFFLTTSNNFSKTETTETSTVNENTASVQAYAGKKVLHVDSYHLGYSWCDELSKAVADTFEGTGVELKRIQMDTKNNPGEDFKKQAALDAKAVIEEFQPDVVILNDDNAVKYLLAEYYKDAELPFVYCGVNWDSSVYGMPYSNAAGMIEVSLTKQIVEKLYPYAKSHKAGYISADSATERKAWENYERLGIADVFEQNVWPKTIPEFKEDFLKMQNEVDIIFIENVVGLEGWANNQTANEEDLKSFIEENIKVPTGGTYDWTESISVLQLQKLASEQGEYAAETALKILDGTSPSDIPEVQNKKGLLVINMKLADKLGIVFTPEILKNAKRIE